MKFTKRMLAFSLSALLGGGALSAAGPNIVRAAESSYFAALSGTVKSIRDYTNTDGSVDSTKKFVDVKTANGDYVFVINKNTYVEGALPQAGAIIRGYYDKTKPTASIFPPQLEMEAVAGSSGSAVSYKLDRFGGDLVSSDGSLKLIVNSNDNILNEDGSKYTSSLYNKDLFVVYETSTKSIPAETKPSKIIVIDTGKNTAAAKAEEKTFSGSITHVEKISATESYYTIKNDSGSEIVARADYNTFMPDGSVYVGDNVTAYYESPKAMTLEYPPKYLADAIAKTTSGRNIKVSVFNQDMVSADNKLKLNLNNNVPVKLQDGSNFYDYDKSFANRKLAVVYNISTKSLPAQTTPSVVYVLFDRVANIPGSKTASYYESGRPSSNITSNGLSALEGKNMVTTVINNRVMISVHDIAAVFNTDYAITETGATISGGFYKMTLDSKSYIENEKEITLSDAPVAYVDRVYVPVSFLSEVMGYTDFTLDLNGNINFNR